MLISKTFYNFLKDTTKLNLTVLFDIIYYFIADAQKNNLMAVYIPEDTYTALLSNTLFAIRYFDDEIGKKYRDIILEILKEL